MGVIEVALDYLIIMKGYRASESVKGFCGCSTRITWPAYRRSIRFVRCRCDNCVMSDFCSFLKAKKISRPKRFILTFFK